MNESADPPAARHRVVEARHGSGPGRRAHAPGGETSPPAPRGETAGHYLVASVPRVGAEQSVADVLAEITTRQYDCVDIVCVLDAEQRLIGVLPLTLLLRAHRDAPVATAALHRFPKVHADTDQERVASLALHYAINAIPVVDARGKLLGVVPSAALMRILRREHVEDLHRFAGIAPETLQAREAIEAPPLRRLRHRLPWLLLGLAGSVLATFIMARFETALAASPAIAFFIPGLVYLADAIGTQTEAVAVRGLSLSHARLGALVGGEVRTGILIGLVMGGLTFPAVWMAFGDARLALAVAGALVCAGAIATTVGLLLPWLLDKLGSDPAYGSGPLSTIIQDLLTLLTYFVVVTVLLS